MTYSAFFSIPVQFANIGSTEKTKFKGRRYKEVGTDTVELQHDTITVECFFHKDCAVYRNKRNCREKISIKDQHSILPQ